MNRSVFVLRSRKTGKWAFNPAGTFQGYGAYVGIFPYRELPVGASAAQIGRLVLSLLAKSGPTGFHIRDHNLYLESAHDEISESVLEWARPRKPSTSKMARLFLEGSVETTDRLKSWRIVTYQYDSRERASKATGLGVRVSKHLGGRAVGEAVRSAFPM